MRSSQFVVGPAGCGKTTAAIEHIRDLVAHGVPAAEILVLVPQRTLGHPFQQAFVSSDWPSGAAVDVVTLGGMARRGLDMYWPLVAEHIGVADLTLEPTFLTLETAQYFMARFVREETRTGIFDSLSLSQNRIVSQILDNLSKAAINGFTLDEIGRRLVAAWGDRHTSRPGIFLATIGIAKRFRSYCLEHSLLDFSLQIECFMNHLVHEPIYQDYLVRHFGHLVADNLEENFPVTGDFIRLFWEQFETALLVYDSGAGYRVFLGADPADMYALSTLCDSIQSFDSPANQSAPASALTHHMSLLLGGESAQSPQASAANAMDALQYETSRFFPEMIDWAVDRAVALIGDSADPSDIVVLVPYLGDSLRFALEDRFRRSGIPTYSHRPSRALHEEPVARAILTLMSLAYSQWESAPPVQDVSSALHLAIDGLDPVRAWLLAQVVYRERHNALSSFEQIQAEVQERITYVVGQRYDVLREWLVAVQDSTSELPPDHFVSRLFGEVLSQPGFGFHTNLDAGRVTAELIESARRFRQALYPVPDVVTDWSDVSLEFFTLIRDGLLAAQHVPSWLGEQDVSAVFLAPAYTFLMRNRAVDYQIWLDVGSNNWWERLEQPLTHPYVISRGYPPDQIWTDQMEYAARQDALWRLVTGLLRRCRKGVFWGISNLSEQGYEQRGPLLQTAQRLIQQFGVRSEDHP